MMELENLENGKISEENLVSVCSPKGNCKCWTLALRGLAESAGGIVQGRRLCGATVESEAIPSACRSLWRSWYCPSPKKGMHGCVCSLLLG